MNHLFRFLTLLLVVVGTGRAVAQAAGGWATALASTTRSSINKVVPDGRGGAFVLGTANGAATFGPFTLTPSAAGAPVSFVARLDARGVPRWCRPLGFVAPPAGQFSSYGIADMALGAGGQLVICGAYGTAGLALGNGVPTLPPDPGSGNLTRGFVARLDTGGTFRWAQELPDTTANLIASAVVVDGNGAVWVGTNTGGGAPLVGSLGLWRFSATGALLSQRTCADLSGTAAVSPYGVFAYFRQLVVNPNTGNLGGVVQYQGTLTTRPGTTGSPVLALSAPPEPQTGAVLFGLTPLGEVQWGQSLQSTGISNGGNSRSYLNRLLGITALGTGFAVAGGYLGSGSVAGVTLPYAARPAGLTARFDGQGTMQWANPVVGTTAADESVMTSIVASAAGNVYVAGVMGGTLPAAAGGLRSVGDADVCVLGYSGQGQLVSAQRDGGPGNEIPTTLALEPGGHLLVGGYYSGTTQLGGSTLTAGNNTENGFVARLAQSVLANRTAAAPSALAVWPNPVAAGAACRVLLPPALAAAPVTLRVLNALGQEVWSQTLPAGATAATLPSAAWPAGCYTLLVRGVAGQATGRVVVE